MASDTRLPAGWRYASIGELESEGVIAEIQDGNHGGRHPKATDYVPVGVPFVMARDLEGGRLDLRDCSFIPKQLADSLRIGFARPGDVLLTHKATMGRVAVVPDGVEYVMLTPQVTYYRIGDAHRLSNVYLKYAFLGTDFQNQLNSDSDQSTRKYIGITSQRRLGIPLPPPAEQRTIAHILGTLDDKIELNRRMNETLETMARALFKSWFVDFDPVRAKAEGRDTRLPPHIAELFPDSFDVSELGETPTGWEVGPLGRFFEVGLGGAWGEDDATDRASAEVRCLRGIDCHELAEGRIPDVPARWVSPKQAADRQLSDGTVVIEGSGSFCGRSVIWNEAYGRLLGEPIGYSNFCKRLDPLCSVGQAVICWMQMRQAYRDETLQSFRTGTAFPNFDVHGVLRNLVVVVPPVPLADVYGRMFECSRGVALMAQSRTLAALRDELLPKLVSGELRVDFAPSARELRTNQSRGGPA